MQLRTPNLILLDRLARWDSLTQRGELTLRTLCTLHLNSLREFSCDTLFNILRICDITSIIWIHDGIWVHPCPGQAAVHVASETANRALAAVITQATGRTPEKLVTVGIVDLNGQRDQTVSFLQECSGTIRPQANAAAQHPIQEVVHEFDFEGVECFPTADNHVPHPGTAHELLKRKLDLTDNTEGIERYFQRQRIMPQ